MGSAAKKHAVFLFALMHIFRPLRLRQHHKLRRKACVFNSFSNIRGIACTRAQYCRITDSRHRKRFSAQRTIDNDLCRAEFKHAFFKPRKLRRHGRTRKLNKAVTACTKDNDLSHRRRHSCCVQYFPGNTAVHAVLLRIISGIGQISARKKQLFGCCNNRAVINENFGLFRVRHKVASLPVPSDGCQRNALVHPAAVLYQSIKHRCFSRIFAHADERNGTIRFYKLI